MRRIFILILILFSIGGLVMSQQSRDITIATYTTENGLPSNGIKGLQWDEESGFLWIATEAGMVRYNGVEFKTFSSDDNPHILNDRIVFLTKNNKGKIYTAEVSGNTFHIEKNKIVFLGKNKIANNARSNIITLAVSDALYKSDFDLSKGGPYSLQFDKVIATDDTSCFILHSGNLYYLSQTVRSPEKVLFSNIVITDAFKIGMNIYLQDNRQNLFLYNRYTKELNKITLTDENNSAIHISSSDKLIWESGMENPILFSQQKAFLLNSENRQLKSRLISDYIPDIFIRYVQYDPKRKTLFLGTESKGIVIITQNRIESLKAADIPTNLRTSYYAQIELTDGNVLTNEGHVIGKASKDKNKLPINGKFNPNIFLMDDSLLWYTQAYGSQDGYLMNYNYKTGKTKVFEKIPSFQFVMATSGGELYLAYENGIFKLSADTLLSLYKYPSANSSLVHYDMEEVEPGVLAIANCNALLKFNIKTKKLDTIYSHPNYCVRTIWQYNDYLFFGTYGGGLFAYKNGVVRSLPLDKNKYLLFTHCFVRDGDYCWISTNRGLFKTSLAELLHAANNPVSSIYYYYFGKKDGMEMTELNGGCTPCALQLKNKTISFPTMDGLLWVDPAKATPILPDGEIFIDKLIADTSEITDNLNSRLIFPSRINEITVVPAFAAWCNKENIYLEYQLNDTTNWKQVNVDNSSFIQLHNLKSGDYTLRLRKLNGFGINNYSYKTISFEITTPWYKSWWFILLGLLFLGVLIYLYVQLRTKQLKQTQLRLEKLVDEKTKELKNKNEVLEKNDSIKTRLISIISHDIVTPLKFLTAAGKNLIEKRKMMPEQLQEETLKEMTNTSQELQLLSTNILNWIKYQNENRRLAKENFKLRDLVEEVISVLKSLARSKNLALENQVSNDIIIHQYFEPLKIFIYNLITNAINFSEQGKIIVGAVKEKESIQFWVQDFGLGMTPEQVQHITADQIVITSANVDKRRGHGLGYLIIKDLLKMTNGTLSIQSEKGKGTTVSITIPSNAEKSI